MYCWWLPRQFEFDYLYWKAEKHYRRHNNNNKQSIEGEYIMFLMFIFFLWYKFTELRAHLISGEGLVWLRRTGNDGDVCRDGDAQVA